LNRRRGMVGEIPAKDPIVSACMIVRNEERFLEGCLHSIRDVVDEIVIGDTGSTDRTPDIVRDFGARLYHIPWNDDFSAARNQVLEQARGAWILSIDADERLRPISRSQIELFLEDPSHIAYYALMYPMSRWTGMWVIRLFRNDPLIRFNGIFHETLWEGLQKARFTDTKEIGFSELILDHLGYDIDQSDKLRRNLSLLLREIERNPKNAYIWTHLGMVYEDLGEDSRAEEAWKRAIDIVRKKEGIESHETYAYIRYIEWGRRHEKPVSGLLEEVMACSRNDPHLYWLKGRLLMDATHYDEAIPFFERLILWGEKRDFNRLSVCYESSIFDVKAYDSLATCHFRLGNYPESRRYFQLAQKFVPESMEYRVKKELCEALMKNSVPK
jgi:glycosyltransferase involved in cell wall biosynthesis